jgi:CopG family nickel-responsive transcriptional regulator
LSIGIITRTIGSDAMVENDDTVRFSVSLSETLRKELDARIVGGGYSSRSEFVRDLIRERLVQDKWRDKTAEVIGVLTISYDHHQREITERVVEAQHSHYVNVLCSTHVHLDHNNCLEVIILKGTPPEIEKMSLQIGGLRGVKFAKLTRASTVTA